MFLSLTAFTWTHVLLSLVVIVVGVAVVKALLESRVPDGWTALYLAAAILTSVTGFGFPNAPG